MEPWSLTRKPRTIGISLAIASAFLCFMILLAPSAVDAANGPAIAVSPAAATVGSTITITGAGFPPNTNIYLGWVSQNATWQVQAIPTPQVTGIKTTPLVYKLSTLESNASGSFSAQVVVPSDYGGSHAIQAYATNGTAISPVASFTLVPHFQISPTSGPAGTPITVVATGLGTGIYSTTYHLYWDNAYVGYMTAVSTGGATNFTFYASGTAGPHFVSIYEGYPGPANFNPCQENVGSPLAATVCWPPDLPFSANFTVTPEQVVLQPASSTAGAAFVTHGVGEVGALALLGAILGGGFFVYTREPEQRKAISKAVVAIIIIALVAVSGVALYVATAQQGSSGTSTSSQGSSVPQVVYTPVATAYRPLITVPQNNATSGPMISVSPDIAGVGQNVNVTGQGFAPGSHLPITWSTRKGSNVAGYKLINKSLRNVTAGADGSFSFAMQVPYDLGGIHYIAAGNLTENSNGTLFIQRTASLSATSGPVGTKIVITLFGVGWDFNTNIASFDYDNSYVGYGCGFSSSGNVTFTIPATGAPGIHTIDIYPSVWWGPQNFANQLAVEYRFPLLTPQDHPELMPSFHFTFLVTPGEA
jgi:hypothetical protein